jgi:hypothetical protein
MLYVMTSNPREWLTGRLDIGIDSIKYIGGISMKNRMIVAMLCLVSTACASTPPVTVNYYLPKGALDLQLARSVACSPSDAVYEAVKVTSSGMVYSADLNSPEAVSIRAFQGDLANAEVGLTLTEDGRLSAFNTTQTGQGSQIVETAIGLAGMVMGLATDSDPNAVAEACKYIRANGKDNVITLTYILREPFDQAIRQGAQPIDLPVRKLQVISTDQERFNAMQPLLTELCFYIRIPASSKPRIEYSRGARSDIEVKLREPAPVDASIATGSETECSESSAIKDATPRVWRATLLIPQFGKTYPFPVPAAQPFGKQVVKFGLADSGAVTSLTYGSEQGSSSLLGSVAKAIDEFKEDSSSAKAAEIKAQADIIAQQERLLACRVSPSTCPRS